MNKSLDTLSQSRPLDSQNGKGFSLKCRLFLFPPSLNVQLGVKDVYQYANTRNIISIAQAR